MTDIWLYEEEWQKQRSLEIEPTRFWVIGSGHDHGVNQLYVEVDPLLANKAVELLRPISKRAIGKKFGFFGRRNRVLIESSIRTALKEHQIPPRDIRWIYYYPIPGAP